MKSSRELSNSVQDPIKKRIRGAYQFFTKKFNHPYSISRVQPKLAYNTCTIVSFNFPVLSTSFTRCLRKRNEGLGIKET